MKVTVDSKKGLKTNLKIFVAKDEINEKVQTRLVELSKTVNMKGFRPGKVPIAVIKRQFAKPIYGEVLEKILQETSAQAIKEKNIKVAGQPKIDIKSHGEDKDLNYLLSLDELPSIKLKPLDNIKYINYEVNITEGEIKKRIDEIAKNQNNFIDKKENEPSKNGDLVAFDYEATIENKKFDGGEGKNTQIVLGKDLFIKGFDKQLLGVKKNEIKNVVAILPENYPNKEFSNKKANFKCKILNVKISQPIKVDDEFAKNLGAKDLNDLKELVKKQYQNQYNSNLNTLSKDKILNQIEKLHDIDIPENLVQEELAVISQNLKKEDIEKNKKENEKIAIKRIKIGLILNELGEKNNLKVDEIELKNEIQKQVQSMPGQQKQVLEYYQKNPSATATLRGSIYEEKIINLIKKNCQKTTKNISINEAEEIIKIGSDKNKEIKQEPKSEKTNKPKKTTKSTLKNKKIRKK
ncbi:MAG: trigger factor [Pelagibacterales bacterium]|nr:trigger factor [Pelagibacterales bacterium]